MALHQGAFGLGIVSYDIEEFLLATDELLKDMSNEPLYYVDYIYNNTDVNPQAILDIAYLGGLGNGIQ